MAETNKKDKNNIFVRLFPRTRHICHCPACPLVIAVLATPVIAVLAFFLNIC